MGIAISIAGDGYGRFTDTFETTFEDAL